MGFGAEHIPSHGVPSAHRSAGCLRGCVGRCQSNLGQHWVRSSGKVYGWGWGWGSRDFDTAGNALVPSSVNHGGESMHQQLWPQEFLISLQPGTTSESQEVTSRRGP